MTLATLLLFFLQNYLGPPLVLACVCPALYGLARAYAALVAGGVLVPATGFAAGYALANGRRPSARIVEPPVTAYALHYQFVFITSIASPFCRARSARSCAQTTIGRC